MRVYHFMYFLIILVMISCKRVYLPPAIASPNSYLVVDGFINGGSDSTIIKLTRTRNLADSLNYRQESGANVTITGSAGEIYTLKELSAGVYAASNLNLSNSETFQLKIITSSGIVYLSDTVSMLQTPEIDSVSWARKQDGVHIYANTHDDSGNTKYYLWVYQETWEYHSIYFTDLEYSGGQVVDRLLSEYIYTCWKTQPSTTVALGTSAGLSKPVVNQADVQFIPNGDGRLSIEYSILVKQYAITQDAFSFWQNLLKNTENRGSLFDPQPSQTTGNIHCVSNPQEPVIGYISANTMTQQRKFISSAEITDWTDSVLSCQKLFVPLDSVLMDLYFNRYYIPVKKVYSFSTLIGYDSYLQDCVDCRLNGGTTVKPTFFP
jgi:Domain of unknown function (DUF4249)